jgi:hypothetical protein
MKQLIIFGLILLFSVEFSHQIPFNRNYRKILPLPIKDQRINNKMIENVVVAEKSGDKNDDGTTSIDKETEYLQISSRKDRISRIGKLPPFKNFEIRNTKNDDKNEEGFVLSDDELVDLIVEEASEDLNGLTQSNHDSDNLQQRQKRGWFKKIWRSVEKRFKEVLPVAVVAALG